MDIVLFPEYSSSSRSLARPTVDLLVGLDLVPKQRLLKLMKRPGVIYPPPDSQTTLDLRELGLHGGHWVVDARNLLLVVHTVMAFRCKIIPETAIH